jgi:DNA modification methylase
MSVRILQGDCRELLATLPDESVHCVVTSPPYWGLRDYGVTGQLGLEPTPEAHVAAMVAVFREVRRVLRKDGTLWLNYGDCYASSVNGRKAEDIENDDRTFRDKPFSTAVGGLKPKDLVGMPWRVAFALQADGWWLRQDIIWAKPNPMPESVRDRCTKAHEYIFMLTKSPRYYYDAEAIAEELAVEPHAPGNKKLDASRNDHDQMAKMWGANGTRNKRSVWTVATAPFKEAHFATFPPELIEPCIKAGTSEKGCCGRCGAPWARVVERTLATVKAPASGYGHGAGRNDGGRSELVGAGVETLGWQPSCSCDERLTGIEKPSNVPCTVLDPFGGAGTTGLVADRLGRNAVLCELNPEYAGMAKRRIEGDAPLFAEVAE